MTSAAFITVCMGSGLLANIYFLFLLIYYFYSELKTKVYPKKLGRAKDIRTMLKGYERPSATVKNIGQRQLYHNIKSSESNVQILCAKIRFNLSLLLLLTS